MTNQYPECQNAICFDNLKTAALYFDSVIPVAFNSLQGRGEGVDVLFEVPEAIPGDVLLQLIFNVTTRCADEKWNYWGKYISSWTRFTSAINPARNQFSRNYEDVKQIYLEDSLIGRGSSVRQEFKKFARELGKTYSTVLLPQPHANVGSNPYSTLVLSGVPLIDTARASWEQILELRKDSDSRRKLRNLRLFFHGNYAEKSVEYISDDLARRLDDYSSVRKRLGFEATVGSISALLDSKNLQGAAAAGIVSAVIGGPIGAISAAVLVELGGMALEFSKKCFEIREFENAHELAYLIHAKKRLD